MLAESAGAGGKTWRAYLSTSGGDAPVNARDRIGSGPWTNANGVVGIKPTVGLVSRSGIVPIAHSQDTAGPMARTVRDAAILLGAMAGEDPADAGTEGAATHIQTDYTQFLDRAGLEGKRIGIWRERFGFHEKVDAILEA